MNKLEQYLSKLNSNIFFSEFTFAENKFSPAPKNEFEFADNVIWIDDLMIVFQLKERNVPPITDSKKEEKWFNKNVVGVATKQIRDTLRYLKDYEEINLTNDRNHTFNIATANLTSIDKIVLYSADPSLPVKCRNKKNHSSSSVGFIHFLHVEDYVLICEILVTPKEIHHYLTYREELINKWSYEAAQLPERALLGHFLFGDLTLAPTINCTKYIVALRDKREDWDFTNIIRTYSDSMTVDKTSTEYYKIISELAKFKRIDFKLFKERFMLAKDKAVNNEFVKPYRMTIPSNGCGFVFVPITRDIIKVRTQVLTNFTLAHKYDQKLPKCIGLSFSPENEKTFYVEWCYMEFTWGYDPKIEKMLKENYPFRNVKEHYVPTYVFNKLHE